MPNNVTIETSKIQKSEAQKNIMQRTRNTDKEYSPLSYGVFLNDVDRFKKSGTKSGDEFNLYDTPSNKYFKLFFYFWNNNVSKDNLLKSGGLLAPTWELGLKDEDLWEISSAYSYLKINDEEERAEKLQQFVKLLSNISTNSPWYFNSIEGLGEALDRKQVMEENFQFDNSRKKISIKCLPDAYDDRIGTLLDLYKDIVWSWQMKREIIPSNLRKFDMGLYIFESPITNIHNKLSKGMAELGDSLFGSEDKYATLDKLNKSRYLTSYKYIEFHNCEIDYNSARTGLQTLSNNAEGLHPEYTIDIFFDDCYESRYNEFMMREIGDMVAIDSAYIVFDENYQTKDKSATGGMSVASKAQKDNNNIDKFYERSDIYESSGFVDSVMNELIGTGTSLIKSTVKKITLGNLHGISLSKIGSQINAAANGHLWSTVQAAKQYITNQKQAKISQSDNLGDLFESPNQNPYVKDLGNLFKAKSAINNI